MDDVSSPAEFHESIGGTRVRSHSNARAPLPNGILPKSANCTEYVLEDGTTVVCCVHCQKPLKGFGSIFPHLKGCKSKPGRPAAVEAAPPEATPREKEQEATPQEATPQEATPQEATPQEATPQEATPRKRAKKPRSGDGHEWESANVGDLVRAYQEVQGLRALYYESIAIRNRLTGEVTELRRRLARVQRAVEALDDQPEESGS